MHKVIFDTNVYISAIRGGDICRKLLKLAMLKRRFKLYISFSILQELENILERTGYAHKELKRIINEI
ncbi:MAG: PIN domain-containing protein, partial [Firmicutes bacterium]|nr:PIN domain-containing protein [Bacillota bacterium]